jgi:(S)-ureidoglycine-glyoxylate aminotransferase
MGESARRQNVLACLVALEAVLRRQGWRADAGAGVDAAVAHYRAEGAAVEPRADDSLGAAGIGRY